MNLVSPFSRVFFLPVWLRLGTMMVRVKQPEVGESIEECTHGSGSEPGNGTHQFHSCSTAEDLETWLYLAVKGLGMVLTA